MVTSPKDQKRRPQRGEWEPKIFRPLSQITVKHMKQISWCLQPKILDARFLGTQRDTTKQTKRKTLLETRNGKWDCQLLWRSGFPNLKYPNQLMARVPRYIPWISGRPMQKIEMQNGSQTWNRRTKQQAHSAPVVQKLSPVLTQVTTGKIRQRKELTKTSLSAEIGAWRLLMWIQLNSFGRKVRHTS